MKVVKHHLKGIIHALFWEVDYKAFEVFNGVTILILGIAFVFLPSSQRIVEQSVSTLWGVDLVFYIAALMILFGIAKVYVISQDKLVGRKWLALVGTFMWGFLFAVFLTPPVKPTSIVFIALLTSFSMWAFIRLVLEHRGRRLLDPRDPFTNP